MRLRVIPLVHHLEPPENIPPPPLGAGFEPMSLRQKAGRLSVAQLHGLKQSLLVTPVSISPKLLIPTLLKGLCSIQILLYVYGYC